MRLAIALPTSTFRTVVIATKPVHRLQIRPPPNTAQLEGTRTISPSYIWVRVVVWECGEGQPDTQTAVDNIHFASAMLHAKCNKHFAEHAQHHSGKNSWHRYGMKKLRHRHHTITYGEDGAT